MKGRKHYKHFVVDHSFPGSSGMYNMVSQVLEQREDLYMKEESVLGQYIGCGVRS